MRNGKDDQLNTKKSGMNGEHGRNGVSVDPVDVLIRSCIGDERRGLAIFGPMALRTLWRIIRIGVVFLLFVVGQKRFLHSAANKF